ncbi:MAG: hypothetical protein JXK94_02115 [Deltaproteobacteria bacterium]|nr:hypothetical protein [Deltaproteobacteria bacterium]
MKKTEESARNKTDALIYKLFELNALFSLYNLSTAAGTDDENEHFPYIISMAQTIQAEMMTLAEDLQSALSDLKSRS